MTATADQIESFIADWAVTGGSELANTQSFVNGLAALIGVPPPKGSQPDDAQNDYVFERRVFQDNGDGTTSFGRLDAYKRDCFVLEAKQGTDADREAAKRGESDFFGKPATEKLKQGTAKRGTPGWAAAMIKAKGQAERYAKALPVDHGWPPFLLITDVGHCIDVYADFSGTGKQYTQFPDAARFRIKLDDLRDEDVRTRLAAIWTNPLGLDPSKEAAKVTREIAGYLADLSKRLEKREQNPTRVADFLMRCLFTMFAEDVELIPKGSFTALLKRIQATPENFAPALASLWKTMDGGGWSGELSSKVLKFNGYLFKDQTVIPLDADEIGLLVLAAEKTWNHVEPAIFGTLLERALDGKERAKLGAHYTPRAYVERLVLPTVIEPLRADWAGVQAAAASLIEADKDDEAKAVVEKFHGALAQTKVLDPACGTGNFLYVALARMKELEGEVVSFLTELGDVDYVLGLSGHTITPENFLGIEINPRAAAIAQLVLWIGYLQWHFRVAGSDKMPPEPVLRDVKTIENRDALITWDKKVLERDEHGKPLTRWDGETTKLHPVTGKKVPDEDARVEVERYVAPKAAKWPKADFIVGNPPFIGGKDVRERLGGGYFDALFKTTDVPESADFVMHWWDKAALSVRKEKTRRLGFVTTNSITQVFSRRVIAKHLDAKDRVSLLFAIPNHPWVDEKDGAAVRIAMTVAAKGKSEGCVLDVADESGAPDHIVFTEKVGAISSDLRTGADVTATVALKSNGELCSPGVKLHGDGFIVTAEQAAALSPSPEEGRIRSGASGDTQVIFDYRNGRDLASRPRGVKVIDLYGLSENQVRDRYPAVYQHVVTTVKPHREQNNRASYRDNWWLFGEARSELRKALAGVSRYIATIETAKHRVFQFLPISIVPDNMIVCTALDDAYFLGVLSSRFHVPWALASGARLGMGDDPRYSKTRCFDPFPFPADVPEPLKARIRAEAESLDGLRKQVLADHADLTLTGLYNVLEALKAGRALTDKERDVHDRGLVTLIRQHHDAIDAAVAEAYGWDDCAKSPSPLAGEGGAPLGAEGEGPAMSIADKSLSAADAAGPSPVASRHPLPQGERGLSDEEILTRLVALNKERAAEEAKGIIRYLRPEFQAPGATAPQVNATLDLGEAPAAAPAAVIPWPKTMAEQITAVAAILAASPTPQHPRDIARAFKGTNAKGITPVADALSAIGQARRLADGRYAA